MKMRRGHLQAPGTCLFKCTTESYRLRRAVRDNAAKYQQSPVYSLDNGAHGLGEFVFRHARPVAHAAADDHSRYARLLEVASFGSKPGEIDLIVFVKGCEHWRNDPRQTMQCIRRSPPTKSDV